MVLISVAIVAAVSLLAWCAYLIFCWRIVNRNGGKPDDLKQAAIAARAFPVQASGVAWRMAVIKII
ncbi:MAG: hypothetical protein WAN44_02175 [Propionibacteriaceae bacterium]